MVQKDRLAKSKQAANILEFARKELGREAARKARAYAEKELAKMYAAHPDIPKGERLHTNFIFPTAAVYNGLCHVTDKDTAFGIVERAMAKRALEGAKNFKSLCGTAVGRRLFLWVFGTGQKLMFGTSAGFACKRYAAGTDRVRFDILECPYSRYNTELGCPELTKLWCKNDEYTYGDLKNVEFRRKTTIGTGGGCCDFDLRRTDR